ncbi:MAG TPA: hypothetical protein VLH09_13290 [Bryobacteraceae bacterium]|nr:hypothetical protein [Bryobacteraceae bacterium]
MRGRTAARFFLARAARNLGKPQLSLSAGAELALLAYGWPGNVRELENAMERAAILCDDAIKPDDLPITSSGSARPVLFKDIERQAIEMLFAPTAAIEPGPPGSSESACECFSIASRSTGSAGRNNDARTAADPFISPARVRVSVAAAARRFRLPRARGGPDDAARSSVRAGCN